MNKGPVTVAIIGAGTRGQWAYAPFSKQRPDLMKIVAVGEIDEARRKRCAEEYEIPAENVFESGEELLRHGKLADLAIVSTQDRQHHDHVIAAMRLGYDILLEKPAAVTIEDCLDIAATARECGSKVAVCHVLRYTMFYQLIKYYIDSGKIGDLVSINHTENVAWWHQAQGFVRGHWRNSEDSCPMILAKSCHDMDILRWLVGKPCLRVSSFGSLKHFRPECAPPGATERCYNCPAKAGCPYDADKIYTYRTYGGLSSDYMMSAGLTDKPAPPGCEMEALKEAMRTGPYGRCVYHCDNNVVDHQVVNMEFEDDITATFTMCGFTRKFARDTNIFGTRGEIIADMENNIIRVTEFGHPTETIDVTKFTDDFSGHGGGDNRMLEEFLSYVRGDCPMSDTLTTIDTSVESHIMALLAEESRLAHGAPQEVAALMRR